MTTAQHFIAVTDTLINTLLQAVPDPTDQMRLIAQLASLQINDTSIGANLAISLIRRSALTALAAAAAAYQPQSSTEAKEVLTAILPIFDAEIESAANMNDTSSYRALKSLQTAVADDLQTRGSQQPELVDVTIPGSLPAAALAYWLYQDTTRSDEIIKRNDPVHPLFMPTQIEALSR
jgi:prophage DNA circulation protein